MAVGTVIRGVVRGTKVLENGREQVVQLAFPGDFFGRPFTDLTQIAYEAATDVEVCVTDRRGFEGLLRDIPELEHELLRRTYAELAAAHELALVVGSLSAPERIASFLLVMMRRRSLRVSTGDAIDQRVANAIVPRRDIARYLSTSLESISRTLHALAAKGIIRVIDASRFEIIDYSGLVRAAGIGERDVDTLARTGHLGSGHADGETVPAYRRADG